MATRKQDINDFHARLKHIKNPRNKSYFDPNLGVDVPKRVQRRIVRNRNIEDTLVFALLVSVIFGIACMIFGQIVRVRYLGLADDVGGVLLIDLTVALWAVLVLTAVTDKRWVSERCAQITGVTLMLVAGHNLMWRWPDLMSWIYSPGYVQNVLATTTEYSIEIGSRVFSF